MKDYRRKYIRLVTCFAAALVCFAGVWHQSQMRASAAELQLEKMETQNYFQFSEAVQRLCLLHQEGADAAQISVQSREAGNYLSGMSISSDAKETLFTCIQSENRESWQDTLLAEMSALFQSGTFVKDTNAEKGKAIESLCKRISPQKTTAAENAAVGEDFLTEEMQKAFAGVFEGNENFSVAEGSINDTVYFYHTNRYLAVYAPLRAPYYYVYGCTVEETILEREECLQNAVVFLQRTLPPAFRGAGIPQETEASAEAREGCFFFCLAYPAYPDAAITVGVRRDTGSVIFMDARALLTRKIEDNSRKVIESLVKIC
ncbi:MAG: hypothetical protein KHW59_02955 [Clostridiales bacterium]|nr:hypothetical protein [Clostridiales bacterium]